ncbi:MAG: DUF5698 domain-containing protein [Treponema sp.]|jgi:uncharacterized protein YebE (UPF0316 family)|nr:DUF5698 domain-containing protein [Treponema sp.]
MEQLVHFFTVVPPLELFLIFLSKAIEVTIATLRQILINKGYRKQGTFLSFFEIVLWTFVAARVVTGIAEAPIKGVVYSIGFSLGVYLGSMVENYIGLGKVLVQAIVPREKAEALLTMLRSKGHGVTVIQAKGRDSEKIVLMVFANRRGKESLIEEIYRNDAGAMITTNDVTILRGGHLSAARKLFK